MKTIHHHATLCYYDGVQVFEARDAIGGHYVAVLVETDAQGDRYLVAGVEPERLRQFRCGTLDLRSLIRDRSESEWYLGTPSGSLDAPIEIVAQTGEPPDDFLPDAGFVLHHRQAPSETVGEARGRNNLVLEVALEPPESASEHHIRANTLGGTLILFQRLVTHAYRAARRTVEAGDRSKIEPDSHLLDVVVPAATGSFRVVLAAAKGVDMFGQSEVRRALGLIDQVLEEANDPERTLTVLQGHRGHFAGAYRNLLRLLVEARSDLRYSWAEPNSTKATERSVSEAQVIPLVNLLDSVADLGTETVTLTGTVEKADIKGSWRLKTDQGEISGKTAKDGPSLSKVQIDSDYRFVCLEKIEESLSTGREKRVYYVTEITPLR